MENKTVFILGAGSTKFLNIPVTEEQNKIIQKSVQNTGLLKKLKTILNERFGNSNYSVNDVYNLIDCNLILHNALKCDIKTIDEIEAKEETEKIEYYELEQCKKELTIYIFKNFLEKIKAVNKADYSKLIYFYQRLAEIEVEKKFNSKLDCKDRKFFISTYSIINFNWDLFSLLPIIEANRKANQNKKLYFANNRNPQLRIYTDFNCEYASAPKGELWYPFTEGAAFIANSEKYDSKRRIILTKCYFPHGAMNFYKCTNCAKHSYFLGELTLQSVTDKINYDNKEPLYYCPYCKKGIYNNDFDILAQSNFKVRNSFLEETRLSMMQELNNAKNLVFIGYSMPPDDVDYKTMFKSLNGTTKKVYVVLYSENAKNEFVKYDELNQHDKEKVKTFNDIFKDKVYYNMAGVPSAFDEILKAVQQN